MGKSKKGQKTSSRRGNNNDEYVRVRLPKEGEVLGVVKQSLGADRLQVRCNDGHTRVVRIPGKYRKRLWCRKNDIVIVMPWYGLQEETRADLVYRYRRNQAEWLEKKGYIKRD
ncbi:MAG: translation initiation factor eIF-1A [Candidatus Heimdallarchaeota archaeon]|nr:translation initiation factor eIF-1A [Candidatus Heimdallarchaeota archaeon]